MGCKRGWLIISDHSTSSEGRQAGVLCVSAPVREPRRSYKCIPPQVFPIIKGYKYNSELILLSEIGHILASLFLYTHASVSKKKKVERSGEPWSVELLRAPECKPALGLQGCLFPSEEPHTHSK